MGLLNKKDDDAGKLLEKMLDDFNIDLDNVTDDDENNNSDFNKRRKEKKSIDEWKK